MSTCRRLVIVLAFAAVASASAARAENGFEFCPPGNAACENFVGIGATKVALKAPKPNGERRGYRIAQRNVALDDYQAWRWMRCLAYVAWAEGRNQGPNGMAAIMWTVVNRAAARPTPSPCAVVAERGQFEAMFREDSAPWLNAARSGAMLPDITAKSAPDRVAARVAKALAWQLLAGGMQKDPTRGATHFIALKTQRELGRALPAWVKQFERTHVAGDHAFYRNVSLQLAAANEITR